MTLKFKAPEDKVKLTKRTVVAALLLSVTVAGCSDDGSSSPGGESGSNAGGTAAGSGGKNASGTGGTQSGGGGSSSAGTSGSSQDSFEHAAACGERGKATANATEYEGTMEFYIIGEAGLGVDVCTISYDVKRVDTGEPGCTDCSWTHLVEYSNPKVVLNTDGACDENDSTLPFDAASRDALDGTRASLGFSFIAGHGDQFMKYDEKLKMWVAIGRTSWSEETSRLEYEIVGDTCSYGR